MPVYAIDKLKVESFGPFRSLNLQFGHKLNVIVGDNAAGKSQLLKLLYSATQSLRDVESRTKKELNVAIAEKLQGVFRPDSLGRLTRRARGTSSARISLKYAGIADPLSFEFASRAKREVQTTRIPAPELGDQPVFLPPQELLSLPHTFVSMYDGYETGFEETWRDTAELLWRPALRGARERRAADLMEPVLGLLQGYVFDSNGRFYLRQAGVGNLESALLAEGQRKLAMISRLVANGVLLEGGYLFWDEPEANLNPRSQGAVANVLLQLANSGAQIFVATHSLYLLRELQMRSENFEEVKPTYIGLMREEDASAESEVVAEAYSDLDELSYIASLEAEAEQANRYLSW